MEGAPLIFANQFIQLSTRLSTGKLYGLGEHRGPFLLDSSKWKEFSSWNRDQPPQVGCALLDLRKVYIVEMLNCLVCCVAMHSLEHEIEHKT